MLWTEGVEREKSFVEGRKAGVFWNEVKSGVDDGDDGWVQIGSYFRYYGLYQLSMSRWRGRKVWITGLRKSNNLLVENSIIR